MLHNRKYISFFFQNKTPAFKKVAYVITWILPALSLVQILTKSKKGRWIWLFFSNHACAINWHLTNSNRDGCFLALIDNTYKIVVTFLARKVKNERNGSTSATKVVSIVTKNLFLRSTAAEDPTLHQSWRYYYIESSCRSTLKSGFLLQ